MEHESLALTDFLGFVHLGHGLYGFGNALVYLPPLCVCHLLIEAFSEEGMTEPVVLVILIEFEDFEDVPLFELFKDFDELLIVDSVLEGLDAYQRLYVKDVPDDAGNLHEQLFLAAHAVDDGPNHLYATLGCVYEYHFLAVEEVQEFT
jgi:hypothetical protein